MIRIERVLMMSTAMLGAIGVFASDDYVVSVDTEVTAQTNVGNVTVNADLTVNNVKFLPDANTTTYLPGTSGLTPQIVVTGASGKYNDGASNAHKVSVGLNGGSGCLVVRNGASARANTLQIEEDASDPSAPGTNTVLRLESNGMAIIDNGKNLNSNAVARIVFAGGRMRGVKPFWTSGTHWLVEAEPGEDIRFIDQALQQMNATESDSKKGTVTFKTDRDIVIGDDGSSTTYTTLHGRLVVNASTNRIIWANSGDVVISNNAQLVVQADECLPNGPGLGGIRIVKTMTDAQYFTKGRQELPNVLVGVSSRGITTSCNWIDVQDGFLSNRLMTAAGESTIRMGVWNEDTSFKGHVIGPVKIEKHGSGKISLGDAFLPKFHLLSGSAEIIAGKTNAVSRIDSLKTNGAPSFNVSTGDLEYGGSESIDLGTLSVAAGRELRLSGGANLSVGTLTTDGTIVKTGSGTFDLSTDATAAPKIRVDGGVYRPGGVATTNRWWRFTFKKAAKDSVVCTKGDDAPATETLSLGKIHLFGYGPDQVLSDETPPLNRNLALDETRTGNEEDLSGMAAGTIASSPWFIYSTGANNMPKGATWTNATSLTLSMASSGWVSCMVFTNKIVQLDNPDTWVTVAFRLKDDDSVIRSYCIGGGAGNGSAGVVGATHWKVESSPTGKPGTWVTMDERAEETPNHYVKSADHLFTYYNGLHPYMFHMNGTGPIRADTFDISNVSATGTGSVDLSNVPDSALASSELTVDFPAGGGSYSKYSFGETGTLRIVNVPENVRISERTEIPVSLGTVLNANNVRRWTVTVNGVENSNLNLQCQDGVLSFRRKGFVLSFR